MLDNHGPQDRQFRLASWRSCSLHTPVLLAIEEGAVEWDQMAGPVDSTVRHLTAHASGLDVSSHWVAAEPGKRRIYSTPGFEVLADVVHRRPASLSLYYLAEALLQPLGLGASRFPWPRRPGSPFPIWTGHCLGTAGFRSQRPLMLIDSHFTV